MDRQCDRPATYGAIFDQRLLALRSINPERERFAAVRTNDFCFDGKFHSQKVCELARLGLTRPSTPSTFLLRSGSRRQRWNPAMTYFLRPTFPQSGRGFSPREPKKRRSSLKSPARRRRKKANVASSSSKITTIRCAP